LLPSSGGQKAFQENALPALTPWALLCTSRAGASFAIPLSQFFACEKSSAETGEEQLFQGEIHEEQSLVLFYTYLSFLLPWEKPS